MELPLQWLGKFRLFLVISINLLQFSMDHYYRNPDSDVMRAVQVLRRHGQLPGFYTHYQPYFDGRGEAAQRLPGKAWRKGARQGEDYDSWEDLASVTIFLPDIIAVQALADEWFTVYVTMKSSMKSSDISLNFITKEEAEDFITLWQQTKLAYWWR
jgi:hypothetical protein